ncbi:MAG: signal peptide peptidase SppA [Planctomycetota bacterium]|jgi:signal peptide peptidase SppA
MELENPQELNVESSLVDVFSRSVDVRQNIDTVNSQEPIIQEAYPNLAGAFYNSPWAILQEKLYTILDFFAQPKHSMVLERNVELDIEAAKRRKATKYETDGKIAVLQLFGIISQRMNAFSRFSGGTSTELFGKVFDQAINDPKIGAIVIDVDSPGGNVYGLTELATKIFEARGKKPIIASVNSMAASGAYWIASQADEIVLTPSGEVGSIGVVAMHRDMSQAEEKSGIKITLVHAGKYKVEGNPHEPLSSEAYDELQASTDVYYDMFVDDVAAGRGKSSRTVKTKFGQGRMLGVAAAQDAGMIDKVGTLEQVLNDLRPKRSKSKAAKNNNVLNMLKV